MLKSDTFTGIQQDGVWFCASNTTHIRMWIEIVKLLMEIAPHLKVSILSLENYYAQINRDLFLQPKAEFIELIRAYSEKSYWESTASQRFFLLLESRFRLLQLIKMKTPRVIVVGNDIGAIECQLLNLARDKKIQTILVQDGILSKSRLIHTKNQPGKEIIKSLVGLANQNTLYGHGIADKIAVMGKYTLDLLTGSGVDPSRIEITGQPRYDELFAPVDGFRLLQMQRIKKGRPVIGFFNQPMIRYQYAESQNWDQLVRSILIAGIELSASYKLIIKLHPAEDKDEFIFRYSDLLCKIDVELYQKENPLDVLGLIDIAIVYSSTVGLEALLLDKPLIIFNPWDFFDDFQFVQRNAAVRVRTLDELIRCLTTPLECEIFMPSASLNRRNVVNYHVSSRDGKSALRIAKLILEMVSAS